MNPHGKKDKSRSLQKDTKVSMNEELRKWLSEEQQATLSKKIKQHSQKKKPQGMCHVCGTNQGKVVCLKCGKSVCNSCYYHLVGLCEKCLSKESVEEWRKKQPNWHQVLGVDWLD